MSRWFRAYAELVDDPKFIKLSPELRSALLMMWCVAAANDGRLPPLEDVAIKFRLNEQRTKKLLDELERSEWIDCDEGGTLRPHNWDKRQYVSDVSTERVKRFRKRERNVSETPPDTDTDTDQKEDNCAVAKATRPTNEKFEEFWKAYPRRDGANPKEPARKQFVAAVKGGADPKEIIEAAKRCREVEAKNVGTPYIPQAVKWLRDQRWKDYSAGTGSAVLADDGMIEVLDQLQLEAWDAYGKASTGKPYPRNKRGGWRFPSKWPPGHAETQMRGVEKLLAEARGAQ